MVTFEEDIDPASVSTNTFTVELDDESMASVVDVDVDKQYVFLKLASELASDATPKIDIADGEKVEDMAGNETFGREQDAFEIKDGISPRLTVTLTGGSGSGTGDEGPDKLTNDKMVAHVTSDEALPNGVRVAVVCNNVVFNTHPDKKEFLLSDKGVVEHDIDDFVNGLIGQFASQPSYDAGTTKKSDKADAPTYKHTCGKEDNFDGQFNPGDYPALLRGTVWEYTWTQTSTIKDGDFNFVVFANDDSTLKDDKNLVDIDNWGAATAKFKLDREFEAVNVKDSEQVQPIDGDDKVTDDAAFIMLEFNEDRTVTLESVELDGTEIKDAFVSPSMNRFVYWPSGSELGKGDHEVEVEAKDAAGNETDFDFSFKVIARSKFAIELQAGWNAISVPADPIDTAIGSVFSEPEIETVIGWDTQSWRMAVRRDGVWESTQYGALNEIRSKYGYWVKSSGFVDQLVALKGPISRNLSGAPSVVGIDTKAGWNFVGVIDQDGDQTEADDFDTSLKYGDTAVNARTYLGSNFQRAYTWDATLSRFNVLDERDTVMIGQGIWVYYPEAGGIAP